MDYQEENIQDVSNPIQSLKSPDPMAHSVFNHTLLSPRQVSINMAMQPYQYSRLVGGRSSVGDRVIENLAEDPCTKITKKDGCDVAFHDNAYLSKLVQRPVSKSNSKHTMINTTCTITSQTISQTDSNITINQVDNDDDDKDDELFDDDSDSDNDDDDDDNNGTEVEEFIAMHLSKKNEVTLPSPMDNAVVPCSSVSAQQNVTIHSMESFLKKTDELIKHNLLLQQQISTLKRETALQTKTLTKLLVKRNKKIRKVKPYDDSSL